MKYNYEYNNCRIVNNTNVEIPEEFVKQLLFEGKLAWDTAPPVLNYNLNEMSIDIPDKVNVSQVKIDSSGNDTLLFKVTISNMSIDAPVDDVKSNIRVLPSNKIPYTHYKVDIKGIK